MRVLITGGTGLLGTAFARYIDTVANKNIELTVLSSGRTRIDPLVSKNASVLTADLTKESTLNLLSGKNFECVVHLANVSSLGYHYTALERFQNMILSDINAVKIIEAVKPKKVLWASSGAVYGENKKRKPFSEDHDIVISNIDTENPYRIAKINSEHFISLVGQQLSIPIITMRLFAFSGIGLPLNQHFALGNFISDALNNRDIAINGTGLAVRTYLDEIDFAKILFQLIVADYPISGPINIGSEVGITLQDLAKKVLSECSKFSNHELKVHTRNTINDSNSYYVPNCTKLRSYIPPIELKSIDLSIYEMLKFHLDSSKMRSV